MSRTEDFQRYGPEQGIRVFRQRTKLVRRKVSDEVVEDLMMQLFEGRLRTGDRLDLAAIAASLGLSQAPVREAVLALERDGVLTTAYHRGVFVAPFTPESVRESFELYGALSGLAAGNVARYQDGEVISALQHIVQEGRKATKDEEVARLHWEFRNILHHSGASVRVRNLLRNFGGVLPASPSIQFGFLSERISDLQSMFRPIRSGDREAAAHAVYDSTNRACMRVIRSLEDRGVFQPPDADLTTAVEPESSGRNLLVRLLATTQGGAG